MQRPLSTLLRQTILLITLSVSLLSGQVMAQMFAQWGELKSGPFQVGFKVVHTYDYSRSYFPKVDFRGQKHNGETARPMQIALWYPAQAKPDAPRMPYGEYLYLRATNLGEQPLTEALKRESVGAMAGPLSPYFPQGQITNADWQKIIATPTAVIKNAEPVKGSFPLVIYAVLEATAQSILAEYLASYGYVVAITPMIGSSPAHYSRGEWTALGVQTQMEDVAFLYRYLRELPNIDRDKVSVVGANAHAGLLFQMRSLQLSSIAVLEGNFPATLNQLPGYDVTRMRIPLLDFGSKDAPDSADLIDSLRYAERYVTRFKNVPHPMTYPFFRIAQPERAAEHRSYETMAQYALKFLDATLKNDTTAKTFLQRKPEENGLPADYLNLRVTPALPPAPSEGEFIALARQPNSLPEVLRVYAEVKQRDPAHKIFSEEALNIAARFRFFADRSPEAIDLFKLIIDAYPGSAQAQRNLADVYSVMGRREDARKHFEQALQLLPSDRKFDDKTRPLFEQELKEKINRLKNQN